MARQAVEKAHDEDSLRPWRRRRPGCRPGTVGVESLVRLRPFRAAEGTAMIKLNASELTRPALERVSAANIGERIVIARNGESDVELMRCQPEPRRGGIDFRRLREIRQQLGIRDQTPEEIAAWEKDFQDPAFSREVLGLGDDWDPSH